MHLELKFICSYVDHECLSTSNCLVYYNFIATAGATEFHSEDSDEEGYVINSIDHDHMQAEYLCGQLLVMLYSNFHFLAMNSS